MVKKETDKNDEYITRFKTIKEENGDDSLTLRIEINEQLKMLIKSVCVNFENKDEELTDQIYVGATPDGTNEYMDYKRSKVKVYILSELAGSSKYLLFNKDLVTNGFLDLKLYSLSIMDEIIREFKENVKYLIEGINQTEIDIVVKYS
jgi:hypothetical protein